MELVCILEILSRAHTSVCHESAGIGKGDNAPGKYNRGFCWFGLALKQVSTGCYEIGAFDVSDFMSQIYVLIRTAE